MNDSHPLSSNHPDQGHRGWWSQQSMGKRWQQVTISSEGAHIPPHSQKKKKDRIGNYSGGEITFFLEKLLQNRAFCSYHKPWLWVYPMDLQWNIVNRSGWMIKSAIKHFFKHQLYHLTDRVRLLLDHTAASQSLRLYGIGVLVSLQLFR